VRAAVAIVTAGQVAETGALDVRKVGEEIAFGRVFVTFGHGAMVAEFYSAR
jgi:hypothetical protein